MRIEELDSQDLAIVSLPYYNIIAERLWCRDRHLDLTILKEVASTVEEIK